MFQFCFFCFTETKQGQNIFNPELYFDSVFPSLEAPDMSTLNVFSEFFTIPKQVRG